MLPGSTSPRLRTAGGSSRLGWWTMLAAVPRRDISTLMVEHSIVAPPMQGILIARTHMPADVHSHFDIVSHHRHHRHESETDAIL